MSNTSRITRRAVAAGLAAAPALASTALAAPAESDAELRRLWAEYVERQLDYRATREKEDAARSAFDAEHEPPTERTEYGGLVSWDEAEREQYLAALDKALGEGEPLRLVYDEWTAADVPLRETIKAIASTPADGLFGIGVKLAAMHDDDDEEDYEERALAVLVDIERLTGADFGYDNGDDDAASHI